MKLPRCSGILLHATSLPSRFGIGDFGPEAFRFAAELSAAGQGIWQVLPLGPTGWGDSPYQSYSAFAGNPLLISPETLVRENILAEKDLAKVPEFPRDRVDYGAVAAWKIPLLTKAHERFTQTASVEAKAAYEHFCQDQAAWLDDYALFMALRDAFGQDKSWSNWNKDLVARKPEALAKWNEKLKDQVDRQKYWQFEFYRQWDSLRHHCKQLGIQVMGDIPIYVSHESCDVWAHQQFFELDEHGKPTVVAGVPPDYFSETGQLWGNPLYCWPELQRTAFAWWVERFRGTFRLFDSVRLDHFRGFEAYWAVPATEKTAVNGKWIEAPGAELFRTVTKELGPIELVAENLGVITPEVENIRHEFHFAGMAVLQFAFGTDPQAASFRPYNIEQETVAYTGTHDNDTIVGWWASEGGDSTRSAADVRKEKDFALAYLGPGDEPINWKMIRVLLSSRAQVAIMPLQDVLGLGSESRMNRPGTGTGNWGWRFEAGAFTPELQAKLKEMTTVYDRGPRPL